MNENIFDVDFTRTLPPTLKNDKNMLALAKVVGEELQVTARLSRLNLIYARIDELEESVLDILAYDLHIDWYSYDYPLAAKREVIKDSVRVHKRLGTLYAVKKALGSVYPQSEVEEWFDYGGEPFAFRVVLDVTNAKAPAEYFAIKKAVDSYKRLTAHMENLIYQCRATLEIRIETAFFYLGTVRAGQYVCGTYPQRSTLAGVVGGKIDVTPQGVAFVFESTPAGTRPQRSCVAAVNNVVVQTESQSVGFRYNSDTAGEYFAGTRPENSILAGVEGAAFIPAVTTESFAFRSKICGTGYCKK